MIVAEELGDQALTLVPRLATKLYTMWLRYTYPFAGYGAGVSIHHSCQIGRAAAVGVQLGENVYLAPKVWLQVDGSATSREAKIVIGERCGIGRETTISARNRIVLEQNVLIAPSVAIVDHNYDHDRDPENCFPARGSGNLTEKSGGRILIEQNCWLGYRAMVVCSDGELRIGRNSVVAANAVVTKSFPPFSVIAGNPAKVVKQYDQNSGKWVRVHG